ncbi:MAG: hypothetical protein IPP35_05695 [Elusimicrobia bacterium]|nr:hypothetical protein [Elusimicrobiota bacterium]
MPLIIPIPVVQELTPEELGPFKDALLAHLRGRNAEIRQQVDSNLHITRGERIPAYAFSLHVLLETRDSKAEKILKPYSEEAAKKITPPVSPPPEISRVIGDVWKYPSEERLDFSPHADTYFLPGTLQVEDCRECYQRGESSCKACLGKGDESCSTCLGAGSQTCGHCKGLEKINCLRCGGEGRLASGGVGGRSARCDACAGTGKFPCTHCRAGKLSCPQCVGGGKSVCSKCEGKGKIVCPGCLGRKKNLAGQAFRAEFKPFQAHSAGLVMPGPREALDMAIKKTTEVGSLNLSTDESLEKQVADAIVPGSLRTALSQLVDRIKPLLSTTTHAVKHRLDMAEGSVVRVSGYCAGHAFSFWMMPGADTIFTDQDPLDSLGSSVAEAAEEARSAGDWKKAMGLARDTLAYSSKHPGAQDIVEAWGRKILLESLLAGILGGALAFGVNALYILKFEPGLHRAGPILQVGGWQVALGLLFPLALTPLLRRLYRFPVRGSVLVLGLLGVFVSIALVSRGVFGWDPVLAADRAALEGEMQKHFRYGFPAVYCEPDLRFLQEIQRRYKDTRVDLRMARGALNSQLVLREKLAGLQKEFEEKIEGIVGSGVSSEKKRTLLLAAREKYKLDGVDVAKVESALERVQAKTPQRGMHRAPRPPRISISQTKKSSKRASPALSSKNGSQKTTTKPAPKKAASKPSGTSGKNKNAWWE